jgi:hypothetical protein
MFAVADLFVVALAVYDFRARGRLHPATLWGAAVVVASQPLRVWLGLQPWFEAFARGLVG